MMSIKNQTLLNLTQTEWPPVFGYTAYAVTTLRIGGGKNTS